MMAARFLISGRVQGVSFRAYTQRRARELGVHGYARNLDDGRVEVFAQGTPQAVEALAQWLNSGSPDARVEHVERHAAVPAQTRTFETG
jgi:acylphosphatase